MTTIEDDFLTLQLAIWKLKRPCSDDPGSAQAIRNGVYMSVAHKVELIAKQVYAERSGLQKRIAELERKLASSKQEWILTADRLPALDQPTIGNVVTSVDVLVLLKSGHVSADRLEADSETSWWSCGGDKVRAWMPLPEALK